MVRFHIQGAHHYQIAVPEHFLLCRLHIVVFLVLTAFKDVFKDVCHFFFCCAFARCVPALLALLASLSSFTLCSSCAVDICARRQGFIGLVVLSLMLVGGQGQQWGMQLQPSSNEALL